jgi:hypothetical protein
VVWKVSRLRAFAAQYHVYDGQLLRDKGQVKEAIAEFEPKKSGRPRAWKREMVTIVQHEHRKRGRTGSPLG